MPSFETTRRVRFTPRQMYALVADVESYPQFLPLCESLRVLSREHHGDTETILAVMTVGYKAIREKFTSRIILDRTRLRVSTRLVEGPFQYLENDWSFVPVTGAREATPVASSGTDVRFSISYGFKSIVLQILVGAMFEQAFRRFAEAFETRAGTVYGPRATSGPAGAVTSLS